VPEERERVLARGGEIPECAKGECARVNGLIEVTRSLGDRWLKPVLDCTPEVVVYPLTAEDAFLVIGSDGLFDCIVDDTLVRFLRTLDIVLPLMLLWLAFSLEDVSQARFVTKEALNGTSHCDIAFALAKMAYRNGSTDDISAYVLSLDSQGQVQQLGRAQVNVPSSNGSTVHLEPHVDSPHTPALHKSPEDTVFRPSSLLDETQCTPMPGVHQNRNYSPCLASLSSQ
jgi:serine/threonine protein phosphatase PrpC